MPVALVTGATGLVGGNLVRTLVEHDRKVRVIVRKSSNTSYLESLSNVEFCEGDVTDLDSLKAALKGTCGQCYILGNENLSYREIFARIARILKVAPPCCSLPYGLARIGGRIGDYYSSLKGRESSINTATAKLGFVDHYYDSSKAVRELRMPQTPIDDGLERAIHWFRKEGRLSS